MVVATDIQELLHRILFYYINQVILGLKHVDARSSELHRVLTDRGKNYTVRLRKG
jgi:hypothetical protein